MLPHFKHKYIKKSAIIKFVNHFKTASNGAERPMGSGGFFPQKKLEKIFLPKNLFNPEHDLCLANGSPNFVPPDSALEFGRNCVGLTRWIEEGDGIIPWGWNPYLKRQLQKQGVPDSMLPSDEELADIRTLSHRRTAIEAREFFNVALRQYQYLLTSPIPSEMTSTAEIGEKVETFGSAVLKAPWSGSGKGLRWVRKGEFFPSDEGWCRRTVERQGSVIVEKRELVVQDFAMLWRVAPEGVKFEGYSLFHNENGMYRGNLLASDEFILSRIGAFIPEGCIVSVRNALASFLQEKFCGRYSGYAGVDMFAAEGNDGKFLLNPCVEINVRMTMGLLARRIFDRHLPSLLPGAEDGAHTLSVEFCSNPARLSQLLCESGAVPLHDISEGSRYVVIVK